MRWSSDRELHICRSSMKRCPPFLKPRLRRMRAMPWPSLIATGKEQMDAATVRRPERRNTAREERPARTRPTAAAQASIPCITQPELPALLVRPGDLVGRELDADYRAILARAPPDQLSTRPRHRHHLPDPPRSAARALRRGDRRPCAEAASPPHYADDDAGASDAAHRAHRRGMAPSRSALYARRRAWHRKRAGQPRTPSIRQGIGWPRGRAECGGAQLDHLQ